ncbi:MAG: DUF3604 domain-containing protein [Planctomycetes bacterium]|nr:DUF3604 domain-containing protein [Planctomycetota bacterium]MBM4078158.1 DUF3604 domain-containing protein [Planctomycetota bacterium]MBM4083714.1 DUF3604 domain-containing protein [Planctomycetota bacterium]
MAYHLLWGDLHNHNSVGLFHYSKGSLERTIEIARSHLDFFAFTGHAHWHDMPVMPNDGHLKWREGFEHHTRMWPKVKELIAAANRDGEFPAILGYEWHSAEFGDRCVLYPNDDGELCLPTHIANLTGHAKRTGAILCPHHLGYKSGLPGRGANWDAVDESVSPVIEIYSEHGGAERDRGPWPYVRHTNGPRTTFNALQHALALGKRFGVVAGTDDHFGYPGAYGEGLAAVYATARTRAALFEALRARRTYAVTGDRIELLFTVNGAMMGSVLPPTRERRIEIAVRGWDDLAMIELLKDNRVVHRHFPEDQADSCRPFAGPVKCRIEFGWGPWTALGIPRTADWLMAARLERAQFRSHMPCFQSGPMDEHRRNKVLEFSPNVCRWQSYTSREGCFAETPTNAVVFEIMGEPDSTLTLELESPVRKAFRYALGDLAKSSAIEFTATFPCESLIIHRLVPEAMYAAQCSLTDVGSGGDFYYVRVTQANGHMAWSSPIWVEGRPCSAAQATSLRTS